MRDIEKQILATALYKNSSLHTILELSVEDFTDPSFQILYREIQCIVDQEESVDVLILRLHLQDKGKYDNINGEELLAEISMTDSSVNVGYLVKQMKEATKKRLMESLGKDMSAGQINPEDAMDKIKEINVANTITHFSSIESLSKIDLDELYNKSNAVKSGIHEFDQWNGGFYGGELIVLAALTSVGKSAFALQLAKNINDCLFISLEMTKHEVYTRLLSNVSGVDSWKIRQHKLSTEEAIEVQSAHVNMKNSLSMTFVDNICNISDIINIIYKIVSKTKVKTIVVDYLQLISGGRGQNKNDQVGDITRRFKTLAIDLNVPLILLSQLNRAATQVKTISLEHLRDSGNIEQDANVVFFLSEKKDTDNVLELNTAKNRNGKAHFISELLFDKSLMRITNLERGIM
jgi:replicative DNA helicase